jgi:ferric iron reductase protein FhuF
VGGELTPVPAAEVVAAVRRSGADNPLLGIGLPSAEVPEEPDHRDSDVSDLIDAVGSWVGSAERRVAASLVVLGYSARIVGPAVSVLLRDGILLDLRPPNVRYRFDPGRGFVLDLVRAGGWRDRAAGRGSVFDQWTRVVVDSQLDPLIEAVRSGVPVASALLWGNVASGLAGALRAVAASGAVPPERCRAEGGRLLDCGPLRGSGELTLRGGQVSFVRTTCCLYYRLPGAGLCGDCVLAHRDDRSDDGGRA